MRIILAAFAVVAIPSFALAQSWTATNGTTKPMSSAPASNAPRIQSAPPRIGDPKSPGTQPAGNRGLRYGEGAADGNPIEIKRNK